MKLHKHIHTQARTQRERNASSTYTYPQNPLPHHTHIGLTFSHLARKGNKIHDNPTKEQEKNTKLASKHETLAPFPPPLFSPENCSAGAPWRAVRPPAWLCNPRELHNKHENIICNVFAGDALPLPKSRNAMSFRQ